MRNYISRSRLRKKSHQNGQIDRIEPGVLFVMHREPFEESGIICDDYPTPAELLSRMTPDSCQERVVKQLKLVGSEVCARLDRANEQIALRATSGVRDCFSLESTVVATAGAVIGAAVGVIATVAGAGFNGTIALAGFTAFATTGAGFVIKAEKIAAVVAPLIGIEVLTLAVASLKPGIAVAELATGISVGAAAGVFGGIAGPLATLACFRDSF